MRLSSYFVLASMLAACWGVAASGAEFTRAHPVVASETVGGGISDTPEAASIAMQCLSDAGIASSVSYNNNAGGMAAGDVVATDKLLSEDTLECCDKVLDTRCEGEPFELFPETYWGLKIGGWTQVGYTSRSTGMFNNDPDNVNLHQQWLYAEKTANGQCGWDWGFRADLMYGVDSYDTQAFGNSPGHWDFQNGFDHGKYGWAIPQAYAEVANGGLSIKAGHFFTLVGYEVVTAPDNFFFSHAFTMYNSEPFTHTGAVATYSVSDKLDVYGGWTLGWDTGFNQFDKGSNFLGGLSYSFSDNVTMTYIATAGDLGWRGEGYSHSIVFDVNLTEKLNYVLQSDMVNSTGTHDVENRKFYDAVANDDIGINQYLFYTINDCWVAGARAEWWKQDGVSVNEVTVGLNWKPHTNLVMRPELRHQWSPAANYVESIFGIDAIITY